MKLKLYLLGIIIIATGFVAINTASGQDNSIVVIVNNANPFSELTQGQVKLYFLKKIKLRWPESDKTIKPVDRKGMPSQKQSFYSKVLKMSEEDVSQYFVERQISNAINPPEEKSSDQEVVDYVISNEGAIGYISKSAYEQVKSKVKSVLIVD